MIVFPQPSTQPNDLRPPSLDGILSLARIARHQTSLMETNSSVSAELKMLSLLQSKISMYYYQVIILSIPTIFLTCTTIYSCVRHKIEIKAESDNHVGCFVF